MKKIIWILVAIAVAAGGYVAYKRIFSTDELVGSIPKDAAFVVALDLKSIALKAGGEKLKEMNMMKRLREELKKEGGPGAQVISDLIDDPMKSGLNFLNRAYLFMSVENEKPVFGLVCGLLSSSNFESILKKLPLRDSIIEKDNIKTIRFEDEVMLGWNNKQLIFLGGLKDSSDTYMKNLFSHATASVTALPSFSKFNDQKFDAGVFMNYNSLFSLTKKAYGVANNMVADLYKDMYVDVTTVCENNSIVSKMHSYIENKETEKMLLMFNEKGIRGDHLKLIADKNVLGILSMSFDPKKVLELLDSNPLIAGMLTETAQQAGLSKDELKELLSGDISFAFTDVRSEFTTRMKYNYDEKTGAMSKEEVPDTAMMPMFTATLGIKTKATFDKIIQRVGLQKEGAYYVVPGPGVKIYIVENKVGLTVTNDKMLADKMAEKKEFPELAEPAKSLVSNNACGFYMDLDMKDYPEILKNKMHEGMGEANFKAFQNVMSIFKDIEMSGTRKSGLAELKLTEGSDNSLYRILDAVDKNVYPLIAEEEAKKQRMMSQYNYQSTVDSIAAAAAAEAVDGSGAMPSKK